jgi:hypothetical protein
MVPAPLLAEIWGTDPGMVNREGDRRQVTSIGLSRREVIEIPWHSFSALPERGPSARAYSIDNALALTQERTVFAKGWSRDEALRALRYGFEYRSEEGDTNPLRRRLTALERELRTTTDERETVRNTRAEVKGQHTDLVARIGSLRADEYELSLVRQSGLFTESEIDDLDSTARIVPNEADSSRKARESHEHRHVELAPGRQAFGEFNAEFGEVSGPAQALHDLDVARSVARQAAEVTEQAAATAIAATAAADEDRQRAEDDLKSRSEEHFQMKALLERVERFEKAFPGEDPIGLVEQVQKEYDNATNRISSIGERSAALSKDLESLEHLKPLHGSCRALFPSDPLEGLEADVKNSLRIALERQKSLETDAIPAASEWLEELNDGMSAAFRVRAAAAEEEVLGLEGRLRHRDNEAKQAYGALQSDLKQADADDAVMSRFRSAFGDHAEPAVVRQQRQGETQKNAAALSVANERSFDLSRQLDELSRAAAAAGRIANEVLETVGKDSLRVHQVVDQETHGNPRREALLTYFSHVLHAPVARNEEEAWMMLTALDDARIEAPVFWFDGLIEFCRSGSVSSLEHVVVGTLTGQPTLQVQGLVDPRKVEQTRQRLQNDLRLINASIADLDRIRVDLGLASDNSILVSQACEAFDRKVFPRLPQLRFDAQNLKATIDRVAPLLTDPFVALMRAAESFVTAGGESAIEGAKSHLGGLEAELARLKAGLPDLEKRASPESISLIRQAVRFELAGGIARLNELADELTSLDRERVKLHEMLPRLTARRDATPDIVASADFVNRGGHAVLAAQIETITRLGNARDLAARAAEAAHRAQLICESADRAAQRESAHANERFANWHHRLYTAQSYLDDGGPSFDASFQERLAALKKEEHRQDQRSRFRLSMAANARKSERDGLGVASLNKRRIELEKDLEQADSRITDLDGAINEFTHQISRTGERARRFDKVIVSFVDAWKQARQAIADADLTDDALAAATSSKTVEIARANADSMRAIATCDEDGLVRAIEGVDGDIRRFALSGRIPAIRDGRRRKDAAWTKYRKGIEGLRSDKALSLSDTDKALLEDALSQSGVRYIKEILAAFEQHLTKQTNLFEQARQDIENQRGKLSESLEAFTLNVSDNFRLLKSSLKPSNDGADAGFEIEADVIERHGIRAAVDKVISMIKLQEQQRQDRADKHADAESQKEFERRIKEEVRRIFYRSVFIGSGAKEPGSSSPRIYLRHPRIGGGRRLRLDRKVSTGQANALALLLLTKLADYAISRDENVLLATAGRRRGLISSTRVVMIDGLFSNVSNRRLIRESLDALRGLKGKFQLIGWIHNEAYENDAEIFPEHLGIRRIGDTEGFVVVDDDAPASIDLSQDILDIGPGAVSVLEMHADALPGGTRQ